MVAATRGAVAIGVAGAVGNGEADGFGTACVATNAGGVPDTIGGGGGPDLGEEIGVAGGGGGVTWIGDERRGAFGAALPAGKAVPRSVDTSGRAGLEDAEVAAGDRGAGTR